jgi:hypothetical protein
MTSNQISGKQKTMRTEITDLSDIAVELSEREMRIVSGGLASGNGLACSVFIARPNDALRSRTDCITAPADHDSD